MSEPRRVSLEILDLSGRIVAQSEGQLYGAGQHSIEWDPGNAASGLYFYRLKIRGQVATKKLLLIR